MRPLDIRRITIRHGSLDIEIAAALDTLYVGESLARRMLSRYPNLAAHVCVNGRGSTFADELVGTELPHLFEHLIIELQAFGTGHTSWLAELAETGPAGHALMRVTVTFEDDIDALRTCDEARAIIEDALAREQSGRRLP